MLELVQRDDELSPPKGLLAARELMSENVAVIFGGLDSPVSLAMLPALNKDKHIYMGVWAAGDQYHPQRRQSQLRLPRFRGGRSG